MVQEELCRTLLTRSSSHKERMQDVEEGRKHTSHKATAGSSYYYQLTAETSGLAVGRQLGRSMRSVLAGSGSKVECWSLLFRTLPVPSVLCEALCFSGLGGLGWSFRNSNKEGNSTKRSFSGRVAGRFFRNVGYHTVHLFLDPEDVIRLSDPSHNANIPQREMEIGIFRCA